MALRKKQTVREIISAQLSVSTGHGLPNIVTNDIVLIKIMWAILWVAGAGTTGYMITLGFIDYYKFDVNSKTRLVTENPTVFPVVSVCNLDPFVTNPSITFLADLIRNDTDYYYTKNGNSDFGLSDLDLVNKVIYEDRAEVNVFKFRALYAAYVHPDREEFGYGFEDFFQYCKFNNITGCNEFSYEIFFHFQYGNCFSIYSTGTANRNLVLKAGKYFGLELEIFIGKSPDYYSFSKSTGIVVFINNNSTIYSDAEAIMVSAGTETSIALTKRFTTSLISPYSPCQIDADTTPTGQALRFKNAKLNYRQTDCISLCYQEALYKHCGCIDLFVSLPDMFFDQGVLPQFCRSNNYTTCCLDEFLNTNFADDCQIKCPLECETEEFQYSISFADYPSITGLNLLLDDDLVKRYAEGASEDQVKKSVVKLNVFFKDLSFQKTTESQAMTTIGLFGYVGGILGLMLGFSLLTFGEILELIIKLLWRIDGFFTLKACKKRKVKPEAEKPASYSSN